MQFKIDTKEIFHVICFDVKELTANMAEELKTILATLQEADNKSLIFNMKNVEVLSPEFVKTLNDVRQQFQELHKSFVLCETSNEIRNALKQMKDFETLNITPTESEAWDIVQMEEIERELGMDFE